MDSLIIGLVILAALIWLIRRSASRRIDSASIATPGPEISISVSTSLSRDEPHDVGEPIADSSGGWILNPRATFPLTVLSVDGNVARELKRHLDQGLAGGYYRASEAITPIVARTNLRCAEIDKYVARFKPIYLQKIEELKRGSPEWAQASERDREDLLASFRTQALSALEVRPYCDLEVLFELEPKDVTLDDALIDRYGFEQIQLYFRYAVDLQKVRVIAADHRDRKGLEELVQQGLARRGADIPLPEILFALRLQDLNEMLTDVGEKRVSRKAKAVDLLKDKPDLKTRLGEVVTFRELFQPLPLPSEFAGIDLQQVASAWRHASEIADLMTHTYMMAGYATRDRDRYKEEQSVLQVKSWQLLPAHDSCPHCQQAGQKAYARMPVTPLHVGCRCTITPVL